MFAAISALPLCALTLDEGFKAPPLEAKPMTWYHMMNGNVTKEGITRDFEAMAAAGIGGMQIFAVGCAIPAGKVISWEAKPDNIGTVKFSNVAGQQKCAFVAKDDGLYTMRGFVIIVM